MLRTVKIKWIAYVAAAAVACTACVPAMADTTVPTYAHPNNQQVIRGHIDSVDGMWQISVLDDSSGYIDRIGLHQGTIINPTGIRLQPGMKVTIVGYNAGTVFEANKIDTPYNDYSDSYYPAGYLYPYSYPYPYYGCCYPGFGPFLNVGIGIRGGYRGGYRGSYRTIRGHATYRASTFRGTESRSSASHSSGGRSHR